MRVMATLFEPTPATIRDEVAPPDPTRPRVTLKLRRATVSGRIMAPPSKSHTHRAYVLGALSGIGSIRRPLHSDDTHATLECLRRLGMRIDDSPPEIRLEGRLRSPTAPLDAKESGTTLRLMTAISALLPAEVRLNAGPGLRGRPMQPLLDALQSLGATCTSTGGGAPVAVRGPLKGGVARLPGDVSSQFVSALLLAAPLGQADTTIRLTSPLASRPYVDLTLRQLREHGIRVMEEKDSFHVEGRQRIRQRPYDVPGDYSSAAFLLSAAAITGGTLTVENLLADDPQGDRAIVGILAKFGARVHAEANAVTVKGGPLVAQDLDVSDIPDLFPVLCAVAAVARGTSTFRGAPHLRLKESDRIAAMAANLKRAGIPCGELADGIRITGGTPTGISIVSHGDHRVAMAMAVLALAAEGESVLPDPAVVAKSYPAFHTDLRSVLREATGP